MNIYARSNEQLYSYIIYVIFVVLFSRFYFNYRAGLLVNKD